MRVIIMGTIFGALLGFLGAMLVDLSLANAFLDPIGPESQTGTITRIVAFWGVIIVGAVLGALAGRQQAKTKK